MKMKTRARIYKWKILRRYYGLDHGGMAPQYGRGKFVDVFRKRGGRIAITSHSERVLSKPGTILLIPYQPNHGVMVEYFDAQGNSKWRNLMDYDAFYQKFSSAGEKDMV